MGWIERMTRLLAEAPASRGAVPRPPRDGAARTREAMLRTVTFGFDARDGELRIVEHCAEVAGMVTAIGRHLHLTEADEYILRTAAQLHELGMFAVPRQLLLRAAPLTRAELATVREQARISAEVAALMHHPRVPMLIAHQYDDYATLRHRLSPGELLLAGIFRVADVLAAVTSPRPYQDPLSPDNRLDLLARGAGTRFHPEAVLHALQLADQR